MATSRTDRCLHRDLHRDLRRGRRAAAGVLAEGGSALAAAYAHIDATFSPALPHAMLKGRVAALMKGGVVAPRACLRYGWLIGPRPVENLDAAIVLVERMRCAECEARAAAVRNWGHCCRPRRVLMILDEVRLILRMLRRYAPAHFPRLVAVVQAAGSGTSAAAGMTADAAE